MPEKSRDTNTTLRYLKEHYALEDVTSMGRQVESLIEHPGWQIVTDLLARQRDDIRTVLEQGLHEHVVYAQQHGILRGLGAVGAVADGVIEAGKRADRDLQALVHEQTAGDDS